MSNKLEQPSFLLLLVVVTLLFGWILMPLSGAILWALVAAILFYPLKQRWAPRFGDRKNLLALAVLTVCTLILILPALGIAITVAQEGAEVYEKVQSGNIDANAYIARTEQIPAALQNALQRVGIETGGFKQSIKDATAQASRYLATQLLTLGQNTAQFLVAMAVMLYLTFFLLRDGSALVRLLVKALPLGDARERLLLTKVSDVMGAAIRGNLVVAVVQGTLGGLIFWALGVQSPLLWGVAMVFSSLLPSVGAALIWGPVALYFLLTGAIWQGVVLIVFGAGIIGLVDNVLRPILVGRKTQMPDYMVLLSTLGGISVFGLNGFVVGPLIAALFISFWDIFIREFNP